MNQDYESPEVTLLVVTVEHGFINSVTDGAFGDNDDEVTLPDN